MRELEKIRKNLALFKRYEAIGLLWVKATKTSALKCYRIGEHVAAVMADEHKYGKAAVLLIAKALGRKPAFLYGAAQVAQSWTRHEFRTLLKRPSCHRVPLTFSHCVLLAQAGAKRDVLIERSLREGLSVRQLRALLSLRSKPKRSARFTIEQAVRKAEQTTSWLEQLEELPSLNQQNSEQLFDELTRMGAKLHRLMQVLEPLSKRNSHKHSTLTEHASEAPAIEA